MEGDKDIVRQFQALIDRSKELFSGLRYAIYTFVRFWIEHEQFLYALEPALVSTISPNQESPKRKISFKLNIWISLRKVIA